MASPLGRGSGSSLEDAARQLVDDFVRSGMVVGVGSGFGSSLAVTHLISKIQSGSLRDIIAVPTTAAAAAELAQAGVVMSTLEEHPKLDFAFTDADVVQEGTLFSIIGRRIPTKRGSVLKEKAVARAAETFTVIVPEKHFEEGLIDGEVPVEIEQEHWLDIAEEIDDLFLGDAEVWRRPTSGTAGPLGGEFPLVTENGHFVLDVIFTTPIADMRDVARQIESVPGVAAHGILLDEAYAASVATAEGTEAAVLSVIPQFDLTIIFPQGASDSALHQKNERALECSRRCEFPKESDESRELEDRHVAVSLASLPEASSLTDPLLTRRESPTRAARKVPVLLVVSLCACFLATLLLPRSTLFHPRNHDRPPMQPIALLPPRMQIPAAMQPHMQMQPPRMQIPAAMHSLPPDSSSSSSEHRNSSSIAPVRFFAFGDWGRNGTFNQSLIATQMGLIGARMHPQFVVSLGDNFLELGLPDVNAPQFAQSFTNIYTHRSLQIPWYAVLGNHDYYGNVLAQLHPALANRDPRWTCRRSMAVSLPICAEMDDQGVDRVDSGGGQGVDCVDFVDLFLYDSMPLIPAYRHKEGRRVDWRGLNTGNWTRQEEAQLQELEGWLSNSQARWKVVGAHHPVFSYGKHGDQPEMVERIKPLLEKYGVDVYINGHDHNMQHIKKDESPVHYFTVGGGSKAWRGDAPPVAPGLQFFFPGQGFSSLEVSRNSLTLKFFGVFGELMYSTTLNK
ncbi:unnamed protein product [Closterium sp. Yama58-4]|nr:unnamed protein product [Closterium sp. Yama58-4]